MKNEKNLIYFLMCLVVITWGLDYVIAKYALELLDPMSLLFFKYASAIFLVFVLKMKMDRGVFMRKKDLLLYVACAVFGDILYFYCEYTAMDYLPVSLISIIIAFAPVVSVAVERILFKRKAGKKVIIGVAFCIFGVVLIIGVDFGALLQGRIIGYILAFICIFSWNGYNFVTEKLGKDYTTVSLTFNQLVCTLLILVPYMLHRIPELPEFDYILTLQLLYLGLICSGVGFLIMVRSLIVIGPTATILFSNFLPVTTTFFGWLLLKETISVIQVIGGVIVIASGYIVIKEKGKMEDLSGER